MTQLVYFDNSIVRSLSKNPSSWNKFVEIFGLSIRPVYSYYLFLEYIGFKKIKKLYITKPDETMLDFSKAGIKNSDEKKAEIIRLELEKYFDVACKHLQEQLSIAEVQTSFNGLIHENIKHISSHEFSQDLNKVLFENILKLVSSDYWSFAETLSVELAWDYFCALSPNGISTKLIRQVQLSIWLDLWEKGCHFPFGKIIDDFEGYYDLKLSKNSRFDNSEDMVDAEVLTYSIMGLPNHAGQAEAVNILTYDLTINIEERIKLGLGNIKNMQDTLGRTINSRFGKVYCLNRDNNEIINVFEPQMPILL